MLANDWLSANIVSVHKKGNKNLAYYYRPMFLTPTCCKVMEHIIFHFIMDHLSSNDIELESFNIKLGILLGPENFSRKAITTKYAYSAHLALCLKAKQVILVLE